MTHYRRSWWNMGVLVGGARWLRNVGVAILLYRLRNVGVASLLMNVGVVVGGARLLRGQRGVRRTEGVEGVHGGHIDSRALWFCGLFGESPVRGAGGA